MRLATSSSVPHSLTGSPPKLEVIASSGLTASIREVATKPGQTQLTLIPRGPNSRAMDCVIPTIAKLAALYASVLAVPFLPAMDDTLTIFPPDFCA